VAAKVEEATGSGAGFGFRQVGGVAVDTKEHATGMISESDGGVSGSIVEQVSESFHGCLGAISLGCCQGAKSYQHGVVESSGIVEEGAHNFLESEGASRIQGLGDILGIGKLSASPIVWLVPMVG
jgi:hypothetical protein